MDPELLPFLAAIAGLLLGSMATWLVWRARLERAEAEGAVELARLEERLAAAAQEAEQRARQVAQWEAQGKQWRAALDATRREGAKLAERASRVAPLEGQLAQLLEALRTSRDETATARAQLAEKHQAAADLERQLDNLHQRLAAAQSAREQLETERLETRGQLSELETSLAAERRQGEEKLALLTEAREQLTHQFKALANEILEEKGRRFAEQHQESLGQLLEPLKVRLREFQGKVEEVYVQEGKDRSALAEQVRQLVGLNQRLSEDAHNLTSALKGSNKTQGNWGELVLERVLEASGLRRGSEYEVQASHTREDGSRAQPDVIIRLPEERALVVDAKVSLTAYEEQVNAEDDRLRDAALRRHVESVRAHMKGLADRNYQALYQLRSLDFVIMFLPVEPAFMLAVNHDPTLWQEAWRRNVLLASPGTLLFVLRTVAHLWRQEQQNRNAQEIARRGGELYDRLTAFVLEMEKLGDRLRQAQESFDAARDKLCRQRGNVVRQAELLKGLGLRPTRALPQELVEAALESAGEPAEGAQRETG